MKLIFSLIFSLCISHSLIGQWELLDSPVNDAWVSHLAINEDYIWAVTVWDGIWKQNKASGQWEIITSLPDTFFANDVITQSETVFLLNYEYEIYRSDNLGTSWKNISPQNVHDGFSELYVDGSSIFIGGNIDLNTSQLYVSKDTGNVWKPFTFNIGNKVIWPSMYARKGNIIFTATGEKIYRSFDNGGVWEELLNGPVFEAGCPLCEIEYMFASDSMVVAVEMNDYYVSKRLHVSMDNGDHWEVVDFGFPSSGFFAGFIWYGAIDNILLATDYDSKGIFVSFDGGNSSVSFNEGLTNLNVRDIVSDGDYMYAGIGGYGVWRRKISDLYTTSTQPITQTNEISIFPNPSNGNLTLNLDSNISGDAKLSITDISGKVCFVRDIVLSPQTKLDVSTLLSGLYFLSIRFGDKFYTGKMVVQH